MKNLEEVQKWLQVSGIVVAVETFCLLLCMALCLSPKRLILSAYEEFYHLIREKKSGFLDYQKLKDYLCRNGAAFHFGKWVGPVSYTAMRLVLSCVGLYIGMNFGGLLGIILSLTLFVAPDALLILMNNRDNENILPELKLMYQAISVQMKAGVYVMDALIECYGSVRERRLREALLSLSVDITMNADAQDALEQFQGKFDNRYVDALCIILLQALESGQAVDLLADISEQIKDMESELINQKKSRLDRSMTFYQLGILCAILIVVLYACITNMFQMAISF